METLPSYCIHFRNLQYPSDVQSSTLGLDMTSCGLVPHKLPPPPLLHR